MKKLNYLLFICILLFSSSLLFSQSFVYVSPKENSILVSLNTNIILRSNVDVDKSSLSANEFSVTGTISGMHQGTVKLSDDNKTILFIPSSKFMANEEVSVVINAGIKTLDGQSLPPVSIHFKTTPLSQSININPLTLMGNGSMYNAIAANKLSKSIVRIAANNLPSDFPKIRIDSVNNPADGKIFLANFSVAANDTTGNYIMILNNDGSVVKYKKLDQPAFDFKVQPNGELSYAEVLVNYTSYAKVRWIVLDTSLTPVDSFECGNGYYADLHDFVLLPNGHALLFAYDPEPVDMSQVVQGGNPNATVIGAVIQELDASKNVVFQWRTWDYLPITDSYMNLTTQTVDLIHANAIDADNDGNILFSMRHLSTILKIDRQTGNIDWILGGKENQFSFLNEHAANSPDYFSFQHDVYALPNGDITLFDNGNQHSPPYSRAVEYHLDEQNKTANLVWEYRHSPDIYNFAMGSVQRLSNGNTFIGWGYASATGSPAITEVHSDNSIALELSLPSGQASYRAFKFPWASGMPGAKVSQGDLYAGNTYKFSSYNDTTGITIKFDQLNAALYPTVTVSNYNYAPVNPTFNSVAPIMVSNYFNISQLGVTSYTGEVQVNLNYFPAIINPKQTVVYARSNIDSDFIALPTSYDSASNELTFTTSNIGDFAFAIPQVITNAYMPVQISPKDSEIVNEGNPVSLVWGVRGMVQTYHLQVAKDSLFSNLVVDNSNLNSTSYTLNSVDSNTTYFWRLNNTNESGTSQWSSTERFITAPSYIKILSPRGGDEIYVDSTYIVRWESNLRDTMSIELTSGNNIASVIGDTVVSGTNAIQWKVPSNLPYDSTYKIVVTSLNYNNIYGTNHYTFTIISNITDVKSAKSIVKSYQLEQNYPNPFNPSTNIGYSIPTESHVSLEIYNIIGQKIATLVNETQKPGNYQTTWNASNLASGIYFYSLKAVSTSGNNFSSIKKMILLK